MRWPNWTAPTSGGATSRFAKPKIAAQAAVAVEAVGDLLAAAATEGAVAEEEADMTVVEAAVAAEVVLAAIETGVTGEIIAATGAIGAIGAITVATGVTIEEGSVIAVSSRFGIRNLFSTAGLSSLLNCDLHIF